MFGKWYNSSIRRYIVLMGDLFSGVKIAREVEGKVKFINVPITYASKEKFMARLNANSINQDKTVKIETILPRMNLHMVSMRYNPDYKTNILNRTSNSRTANSGFVSQYNPTPVTLTFELGLYTRHQDDMFQIIEQIVPYFQPHFNTTMKELYGNEITFDRNIRIVLTDTSPDETVYGDNISRRHLEWLLTFELNGWIYPPVTEVKGEIKAIYIDFFANAKELEAGGNFESVDSIKDDQSYTENTDIPETPVLREQKDGTS